MAAAISHEVESSVVAAQLTRQYVIDVLRTAGLPEMAGDAPARAARPRMVCTATMRAAAASSKLR